MKVYVIVNNNRVKKVFTNKDKAEEYREWGDKYDHIEEYVVADDITIDHIYLITVNVKWRFDDPSYELSIQKSMGNEGNSNLYYCDLSDNEVIITRMISESVYEKDKDRVIGHAVGDAIRCMHNVIELKDEGYFGDYINEAIKYRGQ